MTVQYPITIDTLLTIPKVTDLVSPVRAADHNTLVDAILAIEDELGANPSDTSGTVSDRLDNIEVFAEEGRAADQITLADVDGYYLAINLEAAAKEIAITTEILDNHVSNLELARKSYAYKTANEVRTATTTQSPDAHLSIGLTANTRYRFTSHIFTSTSDISSGIDLTIIGSVGIANFISTVLVYDHAATTNDGYLTFFSTGSSSLSTDLTLGSSLITIDGTVEVTTSGTLGVAWAQNIAIGTTTIKRGSFICIEPIL